MRRREFILAFGAATAIWPSPLCPQTPSRIYRVGVLLPGTPRFETTYFGPAVVKGFARHGYLVGRNLEFESRGAEMRVDRLPRLVEEMLSAKLDAILTIGYPAALAAKRGAPMLPIVVTEAGGDPVATGLIDSLSRPGGNVTGVSDVGIELSPKRLQLLKEAVPELRRVAIIWNESDAGMRLRYQGSAEAAQALGLTVQALGIRQPDDLDDAFATMARDPPDGILMVSDVLTHFNRRRVYEFAAAHRLPSIYERNWLVRDGGLMSYGPVTDEIYDRATSLVHRILTGAKPADLPFEQPTLFQFAINLKIATSRGLTLPPALLARADEVIE